jgi:molybdenum cofactor cytidylyltransferase
MNVAAVVLAAGGASRMGETKLLLPFDGKPLLRYAIDAALRASLAPVIVVTGADGERVAAALPDGVERYQNDQWGAGSGTSIRRAIDAIHDDPAVDACIVLLADHPHVTSEHLRSMIALYDQGPVTLVASEYGGVTGSPTLFDRRYFDELMRLADDAGARSLLTAHREELATVSLPGGELDVDTPEDYAKLLSRSKSEI